MKEREIDGLTDDSRGVARLPCHQIKGRSRVRIPLTSVQKGRKLNGSERPNIGREMEETKARN